MPDRHYEQHEHEHHERGERPPFPFPPGFPPFPPFGKGPWRGGPFGPWFFGPGGRRGPKAGRGDVRAAILLLLAEEARNGYQIIQEIEERSGGIWRPSPGSVYPALQQLEDEGLVQVNQDDGRKVYELTEEGAEYVEREEIEEPWAAMSGGPFGQVHEMRELIMGIGAAFMQVAHVGTTAQQAEARRVLEQTRRALYRILATEEDEDERSEG